MDKHIGVLVADNHQITRAGYRHLFQGTEDISVVAEAGDGDEAYAKFEQYRPNVIIMDIALPKSGGLSLVRRILEKDKTARILILSRQEDKVFIHHAIELGVLGYVTKCAPLNEIVNAVQCVTNGEPYIGRKILPVVVYRNTSSTSALKNKLSNRELDVFLLLAESNSISETAETLSLSPKTIRHHYGNIKHKLGVDNIAALARLAIRVGLTAA